MSRWQVKMASDGALVSVHCGINHDTEVLLYGTRNEPRVILAMSEDVSPDQLAALIRRVIVERLGLVEDTPAEILRDAAIDAGLIAY